MWTCFKYPSILIGLMNKLFYVVGGLLATSLFTACGDENATPAKSEPVKAEAPVQAEAVKPKAENILKTAETDLAKALAKAKAEDAAVLVEFTGSDWCPPCKALRGYILSKPEFSEYVRSKNIVFVELDFPRQADKVPPEVMREREAYMQAYGITGFPTMLLLDKDGAPYAKIVGSGSVKMPIGKEEHARAISEYLGKLEEVRLVQQRFLEAVKASEGKADAERAEALVNALQMLPEEFRGQQKAVVEAIIAADPTDRFGYVEKKRIAKLAVEQRKLLDEFFKKHPFSPKDRNTEAARTDAFKLLERADMLPGTQSKLYKFISDSYALDGNLDEGLVYLKKARDLAADEKTRNYLDRWVKQLEMVIAENKARAAAKAEAEKAPEAKVETAKSAEAVAK